MKKGFTIIELLVAIAIIVLISIVVISNVATTKAKSRDTTRVSDVKQIQQAIQSYFSSCYTYPTSLSDIITVSGCNATPSLNSIPKDPQTKLDYKYFTTTSSSPLKFHICTTLEKNSPSGRAGMSPAVSGISGDTCDGTASGVFDLAGGVGV